MKSLISNYLNSRRSIKLDEPNENRENDENKQNEIKQTDNDNTTQTSLEDSILNLNLKYIDDNDSDSASNPESNSNSNDIVNDSSQIDSQYKIKTCQYCEYLF